MILFSMPYAYMEYRNSGVIHHLTWIGKSYYNSPHSVLMGISMLLLFVNFVKLPKIHALVVAKLAPLMFGVYIIHEGTSLRRQLYIVPERYLSVNTSLQQLIIVILAGFFTFVVSVGLEYLRSMCFAPIENILVKRIRSIDMRLGF